MENSKANTISIDCVDQGTSIDCAMVRLAAADRVHGNSAIIIDCALDGDVSKLNELALEIVRSVATNKSPEWNEKVSDPLSVDTFCSMLMP